MWPENSSSSTRTLLALTAQSPAIAVAANRDIYASIYQVVLLNRIIKWPTGSSSYSAALSSSIFSPIGTCQGIFVSINNYLYCSSSSDDTVYRQALSGSSVSSYVGTGSCGSSSNKLCSPIGIFVDNSDNLYVADSGNNRIQKFASGVTSGTTIIINGTSGVISLDTQSGVILDGNGYLFIVDQGNNRIIGGGAKGFRCVAGCSRNAGSSASQLNSPQSVRFDSYGNLFVADSFNCRVQKFLLNNGVCRKLQNKELRC